MIPGCVYNVTQFMNLGFNKFKGVDVIVADYRQINNAELRGAFRQGMAHTCCTTFKFAREQDLDTLYSYYHATDCAHYKAIIGKLTVNEPIISLDYGLVQMCSPGELNALLRHEYSHVKHRDYERDPSGGVHAEIEMRCDAEAAKVAGAENMKNGLINVLKRQIELDEEGRYWSDLKTELQSKDMIDRLHALDT